MMSGALARTWSGHVRAASAMYIARSAPSASDSVVRTRESASADESMPLRHYALDSEVDLGGLLRRGGSGGAPPPGGRRPPAALGPGRARERPERPPTARMMAAAAPTPMPMNMPVFFGATPGIPCGPVPSADGICGAIPPGPVYPNGWGVTATGCPVIPNGCGVIPSGWGVMPRG